LKGGTTCEALEDFTGGVTELYDLKSAPSNLFSMMQNGFERSSFLGCSIEVSMYPTLVSLKQLKAVGYQVYLTFGAWLNMRLKYFCTYLKFSA
jgi:calpain